VRVFELALGAVERFVRMTPRIIWSVPATFGTRNRHTRRHRTAVFVEDVQVQRSHRVAVTPFQRRYTPFGRPWEVKDPKRRVTGFIGDVGDALAVARPTR